MINILPINYLQKNYLQTTSFCILLVIFYQQKEIMNNDFLTLF
jgi:hypothetical protein